MSLKISFNPSTYEPAPAGMYSGVINLIADLGKQHSDLYGDKSQVVIGVELIDCLMSNGKHYQINQRFGLTMPTLLSSSITYYIINKFLLNYRGVPNV